MHPGAPPAAERDGAPAARIAAVVAESGSLAFLADGCADGVIAEDGALSRHLMAEDLAAEIARVLLGGEVLACVETCWSWAWPCWPSSGTGPTSPTCRTPRWC